MIIHIKAMYERPALYADGSLHNLGYSIIIPGSTMLVLNAIELDGRIVVEDVSIEISQDIMVYMVICYLKLSHDNQYLLLQPNPSAACHCPGDTDDSYSPIYCLHHQYSVHC